MGFDDLEKGLQDQKDRDQSEQDETTGDGRADTEEVDESPSATESSNNSLDQPAFSFDETKQDALYALPKDWQTFEDMLDLELEQELRDRGIRDVPKREKHSAALEVISRHATEIADEIEKRR